jgi:hypothetical protein
MVGRAYVVEHRYSHHGSWEAKKEVRRGQGCDNPFKGMPSII